MKLITSNFRLITSVLLLVVFASCDDKPQPQDEIPLPPKQEGIAIICNEGNYQFGNATITILDKNEYIVSDNAFEAVNKRKLGDVLQSICFHNNLVYLVINNSQKIELMSPKDYTSQGTITGFTSPRNMVAQNNKAYVSEYYANKIRVVDLQSKSIIKSIDMTGWGEEMIWVNNEVFICNANRDKVFVINTAEDKITDSIQVGKNPMSIVRDANNFLWVLCNGDKAKSINPTLHKINSQTKQVELNLQAGIFDNEARKLIISADLQTLYWISKDIFSMSINATQVPVMPLIISNGNSFYALGFDNYSNELFVADAIDYVQKSTINRYTATGTLKGFFKAGILSGAFGFYKP